MSGFLQVTTTAGDRDTADRIAAELVRLRLAACVQVEGPIRSVYRWRDAVEQADEWRCVAKTPAGRFGAARDAILRLHPYDTPEVIATPIAAASDGYAAWLEEATRPTDEPPRGDVP